jgi:hypothetical protein
MTLPCRASGCDKLATHVARGNVPKLGHVCEACLALQPEAERRHFRPRGSESTRVLR